MSEEIRKYKDYIGRSAEYTVKNAESFQSFLSFLAKMKGPISLDNKLLARGYDADTTEIRTEEDWKSIGIAVLSRERPIHQLIYREDGSEEVQILYDIASTNAVARDFEQFSDPGFFVDRLLQKHPCPIKFFEKDKVGSDKIRFSPEDGVIYATYGARDDTELGQLFLREYAHFYIHEFERCDEDLSPSEEGTNECTRPYNRKEHGLEAHAVVYALCVRHGLEPPTMDKVQASAGLTSEDILQILRGIDQAIIRITALIEDIGNRREVKYSCYFREKERSKSLQQ